MEIQELRNFDLIRDEYGNYYEIVTTRTDSGKLTKVKLSHIYFEAAFQRVFSEEILEKFKHKHIGAFLQDLINSKIQNAIKRQGKIHTISELKENGVQVEFLDITIPHPRSTN